MLTWPVDTGSNSDSDFPSTTKAIKTVYSGIKKEDTKMSDGVKRSHTLAALFEACDERVCDIVPDFGGDRNVDHVDRLVKTALRIFVEESKTNTEVTFNKELIRFGALFCNVYYKRVETVDEVDQQLFPHPEGMIFGLMQKVMREIWEDGFSREEFDFANKVEMAVQGVAKLRDLSLSEKDSAVAQNIVQKMPECAILYDADRLDYIGATGVARTFMETESTAPDTSCNASSWITDIFGCVDCLKQDLEDIVDRMYTATAKAMAKPKAERVIIWRGWWDDEVTNLSGSDRFEVCARNSFGGCVRRGRGRR